MLYVTEFKAIIIAGPLLTDELLNEFEDYVTSFEELDFMVGMEE